MLLSATRRADTPAWHFFDPRPFHVRTHKPASACVAHRTLAFSQDRPATLQHFEGCILLTAGPAACAAASVTLHSLGALAANQSAMHCNTLACGPRRTVT